MQQTQAVTDVLAERERQKSKGYTEQRDDFYEPGMLSAGGAVFADYAYDFQHKPYKVEKDYAFKYRWPFTNPPHMEQDPRANLVKAAAMILAEIERLDRSASNPVPVLEESDE